MKPNTTFHLSCIFFGTERGRACVNDNIVLLLEFHNKRFN